MAGRHGDCEGLIEARPKARRSGTTLLCPRGYGGQARPPRKGALPWRADVPSGHLTGRGSETRRSGTTRPPGRQKVMRRRPSADPRGPLTLCAARTERRDPWSQELLPGSEIPECFRDVHTCPEDAAVEFGTGQADQLG